MNLLFVIWHRLSFGLHGISTMSFGLLYVLWIAGLMSCFIHDFPWKSTPANDYLFFYIWCVQTFIYLGVILVPSKYDKD